MILKITSWFHWSFFFFHQDLIDEFLERKRKRASDQKVIDPNCLKWTPHSKRSSANQ